MCLSKKELVLFFYKEVDEEKLAYYKRHLESCKKCLMRFKEIEKFLLSLKKEKIALSEEEKEELIRNVLSKIEASSERIKIFDKIFNKIREKFIFFVRLSLAGVAVFLCIFFFWQAKKSQDKEFSILETEIILSSKELDKITVFDEEDLENEVLFFASFSY